MCILLPESSSGQENYHCNWSNSLRAHTDLLGRGRRVGDARGRCSRCSGENGGSGYSGASYTCSTDHSWTSTTCYIDHTDDLSHAASERESNTTASGNTDDEQSDYCGEEESHTSVSVDAGVTADTCDTGDACDTGDTGDTGDIDGINVVRPQRHRKHALSLPAPGIRIAANCDSPNVSKSYSVPYKTSKSRIAKQNVTAKPVDCEWESSRSPEYNALSVQEQPALPAVKFFETEHIPRGLFDSKTQLPDCVSPSERKPSLSRRRHSADDHDPTMPVKKVQLLSTCGSSVESLQKPLLTITQCYGGDVTPIPTISVTSIYLSPRSVMHPPKVQTTTAAMTTTEETVTSTGQSVASLQARCVTLATTPPTTSATRAPTPSHTPLAHSARLAKASKSRIAKQNVTAKPVDCEWESPRSPENNALSVQEQPALPAVKSFETEHIPRGLFDSKTQLPDCVSPSKRKPSLSRRRHSADYHDPTMPVKKVQLLSTCGSSVESLQKPLLTITQCYAGDVTPIPTISVTSIYLSPRSVMHPPKVQTTTAAMTTTEETVAPMGQSVASLQARCVTLAKTPPTTSATRVPTLSHTPLAHSARLAKASNPPPIKDSLTQTSPRQVSSAKSEVSHWMPKNEADKTAEFNQNMSCVSDTCSNYCKSCGPDPCCSPGAPNPYASCCSPGAPDPCASCCTPGAPDPCCNPRATDPCSGCCNPRATDPCSGCCNTRGPSPARCLDWPPLQYMPPRSTLYTRVPVCWPPPSCCQCPCPSPARSPCCSVSSAFRLSPDRLKGRRRGLRNIRVRSSCRSRNVRCRRTPSKCRRRVSLSPGRRRVSLSPCRRRRSSLKGGCCRLPSPSPICSRGASARSRSRSCSSPRRNRARCRSRRHKRCRYLDRSRCRSRTARCRRPPSKCRRRVALSPCRRRNRARCRSRRVKRFRSPIRPCKPVRCASRRRERSCPKRRRMSRPARSRCRPASFYCSSGKNTSMSNGYVAVSTASQSSDDSDTDASEHLSTDDDTAHVKVVSNVATQVRLGVNGSNSRHTTTTYRGADDNTPLAVDKTSERNVSQTNSGPPIVNQSALRRIFDGGREHNPLYGGLTLSHPPNITQRAIDKTWSREMSAHWPGYRSHQTFSQSRIPDQTFQIRSSSKCAPEGQCDISGPLCRRSNSQSEIMRINLFPSYPSYRFKWQRNNSSCRPIIRASFTDSWDSLKCDSYKNSACTNRLEIVPNVLQHNEYVHNTPDTQRYSTSGKKSCRSPSNSRHPPNMFRNGSPHRDGEIQMDSQEGPNCLGHPKLHAGQHLKHYNESVHNIPDTQSYNTKSWKKSCRSPSNSRHPPNMFRNGSPHRDGEIQMDSQEGPNCLGHPKLHAGQHLKHYNESVHNIPDTQSYNTKSWKKSCRSPSNSRHPPNMFRNGSPHRDGEIQMDSQEGPNCLEHPKLHAGQHLKHYNESVHNIPDTQSYNTKSWKKSCRSPSNSRHPPNTFFSGSIHGDVGTRQLDLQDNTKGLGPSNVRLHADQNLMHYNEYVHNIPKTLIYNTKSWKKSCRSPSNSRHPPNMFRTEYMDRAIDETCQLDSHGGTKGLRKNVKLHSKCMDLHNRSSSNTAGQHLKHSQSYSRSGKQFCLCPSNSHPPPIMFRNGSPHQYIDDTLQLDSKDGTLGLGPLNVKLHTSYTRMDLHNHSSSNSAGQHLKDYVMYQVEKNDVDSSPCSTNSCSLSSSDVKCRQICDVRSRHHRDNERQCGELKYVHVSRLLRSSSSECDCGSRERSSRDADEVRYCRTSLRKKSDHYRPVLYRSRHRCVNVSNSNTTNNSLIQSSRYNSLVSPVRHDSLSDATDASSDCVSVEVNVVPQKRNHRPCCVDDSRVKKRSNVRRRNSRIREMDDVHRSRKRLPSANSSVTAHGYSLPRRYYEKPGVRNVTRRVRAQNDLSYAMPSGRYSVDKGHVDDVRTWNKERKFADAGHSFAQNNNGRARRVSYRTRPENALSHDVLRNAQMNNADVNPALHRQPTIGLPLTHVSRSASRRLPCMTYKPLSPLRSNVCTNLVNVSRSHQIVSVRSSNESNNARASRNVLFTNNQVNPRSSSMSRGTQATEPSRSPLRRRSPMKKRLGKGSFRKSASARKNNRKKSPTGKRRASSITRRRLSRATAETGTQKLDAALPSTKPSCQHGWALHPAVSPNKLCTCAEPGFFPELCREAVPRHPLS